MRAQQVSPSLGGQDPFVKYEPPFSTIPKELMQILVERKVGRNGWPVMVALCIKVHDSGKIGLASSEWIQQLTGLTENQVARGMKELRDAEIICPVVHRGKSGAGRFDRSCFGHVAQYQFTRQVWSKVSKMS